MDSTSLVVNSKNRNEDRAPSSATTLCFFNSAWKLSLLLLISFQTSGAYPSPSSYISADCLSEVGAKKCIFPFFHQGQLFHDCAWFENSTKLQCSVKNDANFVSVEMADCSQECIESSKKQCLTSHFMTDSGQVNASAACAFPFTYQGRIYWSCTTAGHSESWCATSVHDSETRAAHQWGPCQPGCPGYSAVDQDTCQAKENKGVCQFPFVYHNRTYSQCTLDGHHKPWCATGVGQDGLVGRLWGECQENCKGYRKSLNRCLAKDGWPCVFPFQYNDVIYHSCAYEDHDEPWCSIRNFQNGTVQQWQACQDSDQCAELMTKSKERLREEKIQEEKILLSVKPTTNSTSNGATTAIWFLIIFLLISIALNVFGAIKYMPDSVRRFKDLFIMMKKRPGIMEDNDDNHMHTSTM